MLYFAMPYIAGASLGQVVKTARSHASSASSLSSSTFEDLLREAQSRSQSSREDPAPPEPPEPPAATAGATEPAGPSQSTVAEASAPQRLSNEYLRTVVQLMAAVAEGLHHAHEAGVIHRDLARFNHELHTGRRVETSRQCLEPLHVPKLVPRHHRDPFAIAPQHGGGTV